MTVALKLGVEKSNIADTSNIVCVWRALRTVYCGNKEVPGWSMVPNCHHYHLRYNLNRCIAQLSSCSDSNIQQTRLAQKYLTVVALIITALIATRDFHGVSLQRIGEIVNFCTDDQEINARTLKGKMFTNFLRESVFEACLLSSLDTH